MWLPPEASVHLHTPRITTAHRQITSFPLALPATALHGLFEIPFEQAVAVVDSLLRLARSRVNNRYLGRHAVLSLTHADLIRALSGSPWGRRILRYVDTAAESGLESILRVLLTLAGHHVESQVPLPDGTRIDLLVDGILAIEINGSTHLTREQRDRDYQKDMMITAIGKVPARYSYRQILFDWPAVHADVLQKIAGAS